MVENEEDKQKKAFLQYQKAGWKMSLVFVQDNKVRLNF